MKTLGALTKEAATSAGDAALASSDVTALPVLVMALKMRVLHQLLLLALGQDPVDMPTLRSAIHSVILLCGYTSYNIPHKVRPKQTKDTLVGVVLGLLSACATGEPHTLALPPEDMDTLLGALETLCNGHNTNLLVVANRSN